MVIDNGLQKSNCSYLPCYSLVDSNFSDHGPYTSPSAVPVVFMKCSQPIASTWYINTEPCIEGAYPSYTPPKYSQWRCTQYSCAFHGFFPQVQDIEDSCNITMMAFISDYIPAWERDRYKRASPPYKVLHNLMAEGFNLSYKEHFSLVIFQFCILGFGYRMEYTQYYSRKLTFPETFLSFFLPSSSSSSSFP